MHACIHTKYIYICSPKKGYDIDGKVNTVQLILKMSDADADAVCYSAYIVNLSNQSRKDIDWIYQITEHNITQRKQMNVSSGCGCGNGTSDRMSERANESANVWINGWTDEWMSKANNNNNRREKKMWTGTRLAQKRHECPGKVKISRAKNEKKYKKYPSAGNIIHFQYISSLYNVWNCIR